MNLQGWLSSLNFLLHTQPQKPLRFQKSCSIRSPLRPKCALQPEDLLSLQSLLLRRSSPPEQSRKPVCYLDGTEHEEVPTRTGNALRILRVDSLPG